MRMKRILPETLTVNVPASSTDMEHLDRRLQMYLVLFRDAERDGLTQTMAEIKIVLDHLVATLPHTTIQRTSPQQCRTRIECSTDYTRTQEIDGHPKFSGVLRKEEDSSPSVDFDQDAVLSLNSSSCGDARLAKLGQ